MASPVEEIKKRVNVVDLVGSYLRLSKAGANFKALCPFHSEKTPSFYVSPAREIWHCFGCDAGGDIFRFVSQIEGVEFPEALELLASRAGVVLRKEDPRLLTQRKRSLTLLEEATRYYQSELSKNKEALDYLKNRGLREDTVQSFRLGFAPDGWENVLNHLKAKDFQREEAERAGLAIRSEKASFYDRFRSRIMFPIFDPSGRVIGFSGRIFEKETNEGKYINTPNTILYDKSRILYLWDKARDEVRKQNVCVLVEGQMDAIMSHQAGITNVVATSGTALGRGHLALIKRLASKLLLAFDADPAGEIAARRALEFALGEGFDVNIIEVPEGKDPAETIGRDPELWRKVLSGAKPVIAFFLENLQKKFSGDMRKLRSEAKNLILPYLARLNDEIEKAHWVQEVSKILELKEEPLWEELKKISRGFRKEETGVTAEVKPARAGGLADFGQKTRRHLLEERVLGMLAWKPNEFLENLDEEAKEFFSAENRPFLEGFFGKAAPAGKDYQARFSKLALEAELLYGEMADIPSEFKNLLSELEREAVRAKLEILSGEIRKLELAGEQSLLAQRLKEFQNASVKLNHLWQELRAKN